MKKIIISGLLLIQVLMLSAQTGSIKGAVSDAKTKETLIGTTVVIKGTTQGTITDFDGNYIITKVQPGSYTLLISFISYDPQEFQIEVKANVETVINVALEPATLHIGEVQVVAKAKHESEAMLLLDQKSASGIKESIGAKRMSSLGVSDAAAATSKISGVTKNEGSGDIYIRGLGDRYLTTTMNGLPIPSDDVAKKNIDLNMFSSNIIGNVGINKTFSVDTYGDQTSGAVDIGSKSYSDKIEMEAKVGTATNLLTNEVFGSYKTSRNINDVSFGFYSKPYATSDAIKRQSWNTLEKRFPLNRGLSLMGGKKFTLFNNTFSVFATLSHSSDFQYRNGVYKKYRMNNLSSSFTDAETFNTVYNTTGLVNLLYDFNADNNLSFNSMAIFKTKDQLYEQGRNGEGYVRDQDPQEEGAFVRDQNLKATKIYINQLLGSHKLNEKNLLKWALGYNWVSADEPNRIRNEVNILDQNTVQFAHVGDFQQRKSLQNIEDSEVNAYLKDEIKFIDEENRKLNLNFGGNLRMKKRDFNSLSVGVRAKGIKVESIDNLDEALSDEARYNNGGLIIKERLADFYSANLVVYGGYADAGITLDKFSGSFGIRLERDQMDVDWNVSNYVGRVGSLSNTYTNILPALNLKYQLGEKNSLRLAASKTVTFPEFKELAPFNYVSPTGRVTTGNPDLKNSQNYNFDLKWEMFPARKELVSVTAFYKTINDPINLAQTRGSSGYFIYENTGDKADVYGLEFETRLALIKASGNEMPSLDMIVNATKMWFTQDLLEEFQYNSKTKTDLQGAAGFIANAALTYTNNKANAVKATLTINYSDDRIYALGAPEDFANSASLFNNEILEKGFASIDFIVSKKLSERVSLKFSGKNLLNPEIQQTQEIKPLAGDASTQLVSSYKKGMNLSLGVKINLN